MGRLLCRLGAHRWRDPSDWVKYVNSERTYVKGVQRCDRAECRAVRDYLKSWAPKVDVVGPTRRGAR